MMSRRRMLPARRCLGFKARKHRLSATLTACSRHKSEGWPCLPSPLPLPSVGEPSKHGTPLELQLWLLAGPRAASAGPAARGPLLGAAAVVLQVAIDLIKRLG